MTVESASPRWEFVDRICEEMRDARDCGTSLALEDVLAQHPQLAADPEAVFDLIYSEYLLDEPEQGEHAFESLADRFPEFADRLQRQILVHQALQATVVCHDDLTSDSAGASSQIVPGSRIGKFRIEGELGRGGMGIVYHAHDTYLGRDVALKVLRAGEWADEHELRRFENEIATSASLDHPNIVPVLEVGSHAGRPFLVMKLIRGGSLAQRMAEFRRDPRQCAQLLLRVAQAVQHMHLRGILHRDLKPSNILLDDADQPQVTDFGLARTDECPSQLTASGDILGTLPYLAPELVEQSARASSVLSDVYGLGALCYVLLVGKWPYQGRTPADIIRRMTSEAITPPQRINPAVPRDLQTICLKSLAQRPEDRYQSAGRVAEELQRYLSGRPIEARPVGIVESSWKWMQRRPWSAALVGLLATLTIALVAVSAASTLRIRSLNGSLEAELQNVTQSRAAARQQALFSRNLAYAADMRLAAASYHQGDSQQTLEILQRYEPTDTDEDLRGYEWRLLKNLIDRPYAPLGADGEAGYFITFSPDGRTVAVGGKSGRIRVFDADNDRQLIEIDSQQGEVNGLAYSPNGDRLASAGDDGTVRLWDPTSGAQQALIQAHDGEAYQVAFASETEVITCGKDAVIRHWDLVNGAVIGTFNGHTDDVEAIAVSPDRRLLGSVGSDRSVRVWRVAEHAVLPGGRWELDARGTSVAFSRDGALLAAGGTYGVITVARLSNLEAGEPNVVRIQSLSPVQSLTFLPHDETLLVGDRAGMLTTYTPSSSAEQVFDVALSWRGHTDRIYGLAASAVDGRFASVSRDGTARIWRGIDDDHAIQALASIEPVWDTAMMPDGRTVLTLSGNLVDQWDVATARKLASFRVPPGEWYDMEVVGPSRIALVHRNRLLLWDLDTLSTIAEETLPEDYDEGTWLSASPSGDRLAACPATQNVPAVLLNPQTLETIAEIPTDAAFHMDWHPDRPLLAIQSHSDVLLWDAEGQQIIAKLPPNPANVTALCFSPTGRLLAIARNDRSIDIWDLDAKRYCLTGKLGGPIGRSLAFTPDERTLLAGDFQGNAIYAWHVSTGRPLGLLTRTVGVTRQLRMMPDGQTAIVVAEDRVLLLRAD